jgi:hypothetical protein
MVESRATPRYRVEKVAWIEYDGDKIDCTVRVLSITGASIEFFNPKIVPEKFTLVIPDDGLRLPCRVVRRAQFRVGVTFE